LRRDSAGSEAAPGGLHGIPTDALDPTYHPVSPRTLQTSRKNVDDAALALEEASQRAISVTEMEQVNREYEQRESAYFEKAKSAAKAHTSACFEDLICFLEMHNISGAYALAFTANGVRTLSDLLLMEDAELSRTIERCELDAVDEILLLEALRATRGK